MECTYIQILHFPTIIYCYVFDGMSLNLHVASPAFQELKLGINNLDCYCKSTTA